MVKNDLIYCTIAEQKIWGWNNSVKIRFYFLGFGRWLYVKEMPHQSRFVVFHTLQASFRSAISDWHHLCSVQFKMVSQADKIK